MVTAFNERKLANAEFSRDMVETMLEYFDAYADDGVLTVEVREGGLWLPNRITGGRQFLDEHLPDRSGSASHQNAAHRRASRRDQSAASASPEIACQTPQNAAATAMPPSPPKNAKSSTIRVAMSITIPSRFLRLASSCLRLSSIPLDLSCKTISYQAPHGPRGKVERFYLLKR